MKTEKRKVWEEFYSGLGQLPEWLRKPVPFVVEAICLFKDHAVRSVLDMGCGVGRHCVYLAKKGFHVVGIDTSRNAVRMAEAWSGIERTANVAFLLASMTNLPFRGGCFQAVISVSVIHHAVTKEIDMAVEEICRVLTDGGILLANLLSVEDHRYGSGQEVEEGTFRVREDFEEKWFEEIHHFFTWEGVFDLLASFRKVETEPIQSGKEEKLHRYWKVTAIR